jgi:uncharacterized protein (DUF433 family)
LPLSSRPADRIPEADIDRLWGNRSRHRFGLAEPSDSFPDRPDRRMRWNASQERRAEAMLEAKIIDRGRGPEIAGSRITVFDVLDYLKVGWDSVRIALFFRLSTRQVDSAVRYIEEHKDEVMAEYQKILDRCARGNPPELQAKLDAGHERFLAMVRERQQAKAQENGDAGDSRGH